MQWFRYALGMASAWLVRAIGNPGLPAANGGAKRVLWSLLFQYTKQYNTVWVSLFC